MTLALQKRLALLAALSAATALAAANAHLLIVAFQSQPHCVAGEGAAMPAKRAC